MLLFVLVTKPTSKSHERPPPPRPSQPRTSIPPPKPNNPPARPANPPIPVSSHSDDRTANETDAMPDIAQPEVDLLNMLPRSNNNNISSSKGNLNIPAKEASFDLLGSFETTETTAPAPSAMPDLLSESKVKSSQGLDDLFGAFAPTNNNNTAPNSSNLPDLSTLGLNFNAKNTASATTFDPFGNESNFIGNAELLRPTSTDTSPSSTHSKPPPSSTASTNKDPFADIANLASGLNLGWGSQQSSSTGTATAASSKPATVPSPHTTQFSSPTHQFGGFVPNSTNQARSPMDNQPAPSSSQKPDYNRSHFETKPKQNGASTSNNSNGATAAAASGGTGDIFADILGQQGYNFATKSQVGPRSINEMRKEELIKDMDPDKLKIMEWVS